MILSINEVIGNIHLYIFPYKIREFKEFFILLRDFKYIEHIAFIKSISSM